MLHKIFDNGLVAMRKRNVKLMLNKPSYVAMCLFSTYLCSNSIMIVLKKYDNNSRILFIDTESLMYEIKAEDADRDFRERQRNV